MAALTQLDQNPDQESQALKAMQSQLLFMQARYELFHPLSIALQKANDAVYAAELVYVPYLDKRFEVTDA